MGKCAVKIFERIPGQELTAAESIMTIADLTLFKDSARISSLAFLLSDLFKIVKEDTLEIQPGQRLCLSCSANVSLL